MTSSTPVAGRLLAVAVTVLLGCVGFFGARFFGSSLPGQTVPDGPSSSVGMLGGWCCQPAPEPPGYACLPSRPPTGNELGIVCDQPYQDYFDCLAGCEGLYGGVGGDTGSGPADSSASSAQAPPPSSPPASSQQASSAAPPPPTPSSSRPASSSRAAVASSPRPSSQPAAQHNASSVARVNTASSPQVQASSRIASSRRSSSRSSLTPPPVAASSPPPLPSSAPPSSPPAASSVRAASSPQALDLPAASSSIAAQQAASSACPARNFPQVGAGCFYVCPADVCRLCTLVCGTTWLFEPSSSSSEGRPASRGPTRQIVQSSSRVSLSSSVVSSAPECVVNEHCPEGYWCNGERCEPGCRADRECAADEQCVRGACNRLTLLVPSSAAVSSSMSSVRVVPPRTLPAIVLDLPSLPAAPSEPNCSAHADCGAGFFCQGGMCEPIPVNPPAGDTGPAAAVLLGAAGASAGLAWMRKRRLKK